MSVQDLGVHSDTDICPGTSPTFFQVWVPLRGATTIVPGGRLYDLPIQPKAELPLEYLVLVPMQMKRRCCVGSRSMFYQAKFVFRFLAWNCHHDFFQRIDLKRAGILDSLNKCDFVRLWCQAYSL